MLTKIETERKFVITEIPKEMVPFEKKYVYQNYLSVKKDEEIRIRMQDEDGIRKFDISYKSGSGLTRENLNFDIGESIYYDLSDKIIEKPIKKYRQFYHWGDHQIMVDIYLETESPLIIAEVEFDSEKEAEDFIPPNWFGDDVTYDENFKNKNLWKRIQ